MRVFITGASGHIGSAVVPELLEAGHQVTGLARSDASAAALAAAHADVLPGTIDDLDLLRAAAADADGVIHLAFKHEAMRSGDMQGAAAADLAAIEAILDALAGTDKPFVGTSGTLLLAMAAPGRIGTEADAAPGGGRADAENLTIATSARGVRTSVIRLPPTVHSSLDHHGFIPALIGIARAKGVAGYVGDGANRWPAGHTLDAAAPVPAGAGSGPGRDPAARGRRRGRAVQGDRGVHRPQPRPAGREHRRRGRQRALRLPRRPGHAGQPDLGRADPQAPRLGACSPRADRRHGRGSLFPQLNGYRLRLLKRFLGAGNREHNGAVTIPTGPRHRISRVEARGGPAPRPDGSPPPRDDTDLERLLALVARGDQSAFEAVYDRLAGPVYGLVRKVLRDPAQSEEVAQEVLLEVWRTAVAVRSGPGQRHHLGAHDRAPPGRRPGAVRDRGGRTGAERRRRARPGDEVAETVEASMDAEQVRRCLDGLTELQRESITLAYYGGYTYPQVAKTLEVALGTVKTRIRDGLMRLRDCLGRSW